ncbi:MAG: hypothetical protein LBD18_06665 [Treponema sp.]|jgi:hypothetical protein|nr:hypothetical protein [Treponema sp.]
MSTFGIVIYILWLVFLFLLPALVFARFLLLPENLARLEGLAVDPYFDQEKNVTRVNTNYDEFAAAVCAGAGSVSEKNFLVKIVHKLKLPGKFNIPLAILGVMCGDARIGVKYHPHLYLARYKNSIRHFTGYAVLGSFLPALVLLLKPNPENLFNVMVPQVCGLGLVFILYLVLRYLFEAFETVFYKNWFDGILNFDVLSFQKIRPQVLDSLDTVFQQSMWKNLNEGNDALAGQIEKFRQFREQGQELSGKEIVETARTTTAGLEELKEALEKICVKADESFQRLNSIASRNSVNINVITENTRSMIDLRDLLLEWRNGPQNTEQKALQEITEALVHSIRQSFRNMENTVEINAKGLSESFEGFFNVCHSLSVLPTIDDEQALITALQELNRHLRAAVKETGGETNSEV